MIYDGFKIGSTEFIHDAYCECGKQLIEVSNGFLSRALFCENCENVYLLKKTKLRKDKITKEFLLQCRIEVEFEKRKPALHVQVEDELKSKPQPKKKK